MKRRWDQASVEERGRWLEQADPIIRKHFRAEGPLPMRSLWSAVIPDLDEEMTQAPEQAACGSTGLLTPPPSEEAAA